MRIAASHHDASPMSDLLAQLQQDGVASSEATLHPLAGGVSSDIYRVEDAGKVFVVKRALARLRVQQKWLADTSRNDFEQRCLRYIGKFLPQAAPAILASGAGYFAMEYFETGFVNWKSQLLSGRGRGRDAGLAGTILGQIHAHSFGDPIAARDFNCPHNFLQLRVEPYLLAVARRHRRIAPVVKSEADRLMATRECLVHGDYSPKNLLLGENRLIVLDCEVAYYGDPAFDVAFMLSHLLLKAAFWSGRTTSFRLMVSEFCNGYARARNAGIAQQRQCDFRIARLLPMLLLARVDGKSPVDYLNRMQQSFVRDFAIDAILAKQPRELCELCDQWFRSFRAIRVLR